MNTQQKFDILPEDRINLTKDQRTLISLALEKQLPYEDAEFLENVQSKADSDSYAKINTYFVKKYGKEFGEILLAAITSGKEGCKAAINEIETKRAKDRLKRSKN